MHVPPESLARAQPKIGIVERKHRYSQPTRRAERRHLRRQGGFAAAL